MRNLVVTMTAADKLGYIRASLRPRVSPLIPWFDRHRGFSRLLGSRIGQQRRTTRYVMCKHVWEMVSIVALTAFATLPAMAAGSAYRLLVTIDLPGDKGGHGDWVTFDPDTDTVWLAQSPDHNVVVIDARTNTVKSVISGISDGNVVALTQKCA